MKRYKHVLILLTGILVIASCTTTKTKQFVNSFGDKPSWAKSANATWEENNKIFIRAASTIKGNEKIETCYELAKLNAKDILVLELQNSIKETIDNTLKSMSGPTEIILGKSKTSEFAGQITGLKFTEKYFERSLMGKEERVECLILSEITQKDYDKVKHIIVNKVQKADPAIKEAVEQERIDFFARSDKEIK